VSELNFPEARTTLFSDKNIGFMKFWYGTSKVLQAVTSVIIIVLLSWLETLSTVKIQSVKLVNLLLVLATQ
jgi:hypothetical protein